MQFRDKKVYTLTQKEEIMANVYVIGIGGTGMRCIENFIHLCAIGMMDNTTVHMLALDTDKNNGNFKRLSSLVGHYNAINGGSAKADTLFSAELKYYQFSPNYDGNGCTFDNIVNKERLANSDAIDENTKTHVSDLLDLFIRPEVGQMNLEHGYRAQTQMGSMLMYHAIQEEAYKAKTNETSELRRFLSALNEGTGHNVFVFGSVFGGTGASTIPVIPEAFNAAAEILFGSGRDIIKGNNFGSVVLTNYFTFDMADQGGQVVAKADKFALNSQAALNFYRKDNTINEVYKRLYLIGRGDEMRLLKSGGTGGEKQCNPVDYVELMAAFAAYDFFKCCGKLATDDKVFEKNKENKFVFRSLNEGAQVLTFENFVQGEDVELFKRKLGIMTVASYLDSVNEYFENLRKDEVSFDESLLNNHLKPYFRHFGLAIDEQENVISGWLDQIFNSAKADNYVQGAFFKPDLFECTTRKMLKKYDINKELYNLEDAPKFNVGLFKTPFDIVRTEFSKTKSTRTNSVDAMLERTYLTLRKLYFNE